MRQVAEVCLRRRYELGITPSGVVKRQVLQPAQELGPMLLKVISENLAKVALPVAVAEQHHPISVRDGLLQCMKVGVVERRPLSGDIAIMAMAQMLTASP